MAQVPYNQFQLGMRYNPAPIPAWPEGPVPGLQVRGGVWPLGHPMRQQQQQALGVPSMSMNNNPPSARPPVGGYGQLTGGQADLVRQQVAQGKRMGGGPPPGMGFQLGGPGSLPQVPGLVQSRTPTMPGSGGGAISQGGLRQAQPPQMSANVPAWPPMPTGPVRPAQVNWSGGSAWRQPNPQMNQYNPFARRY